MDTNKEKKDMILVTGGAGFIGSNTCVELINAGYDVAVADDLSNSKIEAIRRAELITASNIKFYKTDLRDKEETESIFKENDIKGVIHFAGYKAVGESVKDPLKYFNNNIESTIALCELMQKYNVKNFVFSSSATVYGEDNPIPYKENMPYGTPTSAYARTKIIIEQILKDLYKMIGMNVSILRYFNPIGAHSSGLLGEDPLGIPNNLFPYVLKTAIGEYSHVNIYGNDYDTPDGTGVRDYVHVSDLAQGHVLALKQLEEQGGLFTYNLATGKGYSVLDVINAMSEVIGRPIDYEFCPRRDGDIAMFYADNSKAEAELGFVAQRGLKQMCEDGWNYIKRNPKGL